MAFRNELEQFVPFSSAGSTSSAPCQLSRPACSIACWTMAAVPRYSAVRSSMSTERRSSGSKISRFDVAPRLRLPRNDQRKRRTCGSKLTSRETSTRWLIGPFRGERHKAMKSKSKLRAAGLNFIECFYALGMLPEFASGRFPFGQECSGVIARVGDNVRAFKPGDEVIAYGTSCLSLVRDARRDLCSIEAGESLFRASCRAACRLLDRVARPYESSPSSARGAGCSSTLLPGVSASPLSG